MTPASHRTTTILIVDDHEWAREALGMLLTPEGYSLHFAASGPDAIDLAVTLQPDLILLDVMMPGMDGFEVCQHIRGNPAVALVPIILVTALDDPEAMIRGLSVGADDFVVKPYNRTELRARIRTIIQLNRYRLLLDERLRFERVVERSPNGLLILDNRNIIQLANPAAETLLTVAGQPALAGCDFLQFLPDDQRHVLTHLTAVLNGLAATARCEAILRRADNSRLPVDIDIGDIDWEGAPATQVTLRDITDRKRAELLEEDRRQIAYELHDGVAQLATSTYQHIQIIGRRSRSRSAALHAIMARAEDLARRTVIEVRRVIEGLRPTALDDFGLSGAIRMQVEALQSQGWNITFDERLGNTRLPQAMETALFRITQESLTNIQKHAGPTPVQITLTRHQDTVTLAIRDWGRGFAPDAISAANTPGSRIGLRGIADRAALLGGAATIESHPGAGVHIIIEAPVPAVHEEGAPNVQ